MYCQCDWLLFHMKQNFEDDVYVIVCVCVCLIKDLKVGLIKIYNWRKM